MGFLGLHCAEHDCASDCARCRRGGCFDATTEVERNLREAVAEIRTDFDRDIAAARGPRRIYIIGSMRNPDAIIAIANRLTAAGHEVFSDWVSPGPDADMYWQDYERRRGRTFLQAIAGPHAQNVFDFDMRWLTWADTVVLVAPAGKSGHLELGWAIGQGKEGYVLLDGEPDRYDVMLRLATGIFLDERELVAALAAR